MESKERSIAGLYYRYKRRSDDDIRNYLTRIKIVKVDNKGIGTIQGYYPLSDDAMVKINEKPRNTSLTFDGGNTADYCIGNLEVYKSIRYLVKSSSRFYLKPDVGEIFDQLDYEDLFDRKLKAIEFINDSYQELDDTSGEHFIMVANLLKEKE